MSAQAVGEVWEHSPYQGALLILHLAIADVVNDSNDDEFWMSSKRLARKVRQHPRNVRRNLHRLVEDGTLELLQVGGGSLASRYRWVHLKGEGLSTPGGTSTPPGHTTQGGGSEARGGGACRHDPPGPDDTRNSSSNSSGTKEELNRFAEFWGAYALKRDKENAVKAWKTHVMKPGVDQQMVIDAAKAYVKDCRREGAPKQKYAEGWLTGHRWEDELEGGRAAGTGGRQHSTGEQQDISVRWTAVLMDIEDDDERLAFEKAGPWAWWANQQENTNG